MWSPVAQGESTLAEAFLAQCLHMQSCAQAKLSSSDMDPAMVQMIQTKMQGQCEAQLPKITEMQAQGSEHADRLRQCFEAMAVLSCEQLEGRPEIAACSPP